tara:strand:+ start:617 stop:1048 length:432 start_codon:yes stop_codon:yes gene_type:complete
MKKAERERNLALVEQAIHRHGWSMQVERALAVQLGVTHRTIRTYRREVENLVRKETDRDRRMVRASLLVELKGHIRAARDAGKYGAVASMTNTMARMLGVLDPEPAPIPDNLEATSNEDLLAELARDLTDADLEALARLKGGG